MFNIFISESPSIHFRSAWPRYVPFALGFDICKHEVSSGRRLLRACFTTIAHGSFASANLFVVWLFGCHITNFYFTFFCFSHINFTPFQAVTLFSPYSTCLAATFYDFAIVLFMQKRFFAARLGAVVAKREGDGKRRSANELATIKIVARYGVSGEE